MIEINYIDSAGGMPTCFDLTYCLRDYIPEKYFEKNRITELEYYLDLFEKYGLLEERKPVLLIWSRYYKCKYKDISFMMDYDEDYDLVGFSVPDHQYREEIAEYICSLIEQTRNIENKENVDM